MVQTQTSFTNDTKMNPLNSIYVDKLLNVMILLVHNILLLYCSLMSCFPTCTKPKESFKYGLALDSKKKHGAG